MVDRSMAPWGHCEALDVGTSAVQGQAARVHETHLLRTLTEIVDPLANVRAAMLDDKGLPLKGASSQARPLNVPKQFGKDFAHLI
jgi:hypothetical protein